LELWLFFRTSFSQILFSPNTFSQFWNVPPIFKSYAIYTNLTHVHDTMSICIPNTSPNVDLPTMIQILRQFAYDDSPTYVLDIIGKRANPRQWVQYSIASYVIKSYNRGTTPLSKKLRSIGYINDRCPKRARYFDASRLKIGRQDLPNRLDFLNLKFDWICDPSDAYIRTNLKNEFFTV